MGFIYWFALFSTASFANMLGLNISSTFNSAITIYILIPLLMIPMMILSGAMFSFDKLNRTFGRVDKVPFIAEIMVTRWGYEALMVHHFKDNEFTKLFYELERQESVSDFKKVYWLPEMYERLGRVDKEVRTLNHIDVTKSDFKVLVNEIKKENSHAAIIEANIRQKGDEEAIKLIKPVYFNEIIEYNSENFNPIRSRKVYEYLKSLDTFYSTLFKYASRKRQNKINYYLENKPERYQEYYDRYFNEAIADMLKKVYEKNKIMEYKNQLVQHIDPIYQIPIPLSKLSFRTHFFAPKKHFLGKYFDTYWFNMAFIWMLTAILYLFLYFDVFKTLLTIGNRLKRK